MKFFNEFFFRKIRIIFDIKIYVESQNFAYFDDFYSSDLKA